MKEMNLLRVSLATAVVLLCAQGVQADVIEQVTLATAPLIGDAAGPFSVDFQLNGGNGNTAALSDFSFGSGGAASGTPTLIGGASGSVAGTVVLAETGFLNEFTQTFVPGSQISFKLDLTTNTKPMGFPDEFAFAILDKTGADLPTNGPFDVFVDVAVTQSPTVSAYGSDPTRSPAGGGGPLSIAAPSAAPPVSSVPEPTPAFLLLAAGFAGHCLVLRRRLATSRKNSWSLVQRHNGNPGKVDGHD